MSEKYDLIVIGAGPGGYTAAISAAQQGMKVALAEARSAGGTCLNRGCIPTKTLLHSSNMFREMKNGGSIGICAENLSYDMAAIYHRKDEIVTDIRASIETLLKANKIEPFFGTAKILSAQEVEVCGENDTIVLNTARILISTGAIPSRPAD